MIEGQSDTWFTVQEFAQKIGRSKKTVENWASAGKIQFVHLNGVRLVSLKAVENLITHHASAVRDEGALAQRLMGKDRGRRAS